MPKRMTPKFLATSMAIVAVEMVLEAIMDGPLSHHLKRKACHIVVLVPSIKNDRETDSPDSDTLQPTVFYERSVGKESWERDYAKIARNKALQLCRGTNDERSGIIPHLLFSGDTPYWGGVERQGIVVACSGLQSHFDRLISGMVVDIILALAENEWEISQDKRDGNDFLL